MIVFVSTMNREDCRSGSVIRTIVGSRNSTAPHDWISILGEGPCGFHEAPCQLQAIPYRSPDQFLKRRSTHFLLVSERLE